MEEPEGWSELQQKAFDETDPQRLVEIIDKLISMLTLYEKKTASESATSNSGQPERSPDNAA
jgi:hypothetical protein